MTRTGPPPTGKSETRFADSKPSSYDAKNRTVDCIISMGSPVARFYGIEVLRISPEAVDLSRMQNGSMIPVLDSHQAGSIGNALGKITKTWFDRGALWGQIRFNETPIGKLAEGMTARGEISGISAGYCVRDWQITDSEGRVIDPDVDRIRWDDDGMTFTATKWELHECSICTIPADPLSGIRSLGSNADRAFTGISNANDVLAWMQCRQRMLERQTAYHDRRAVIGNTDQPAASAWRRGTASKVFP
jgi:phage head maturation protease